MSALTTTARPRPQARPEREGTARRPELRVVPRRARRGRYFVAMVLLLAAGIFGSVALSALAAESAFAARELESEIQTLAYRYDELTAEVARLESPERVRSVATTELGMVRAEEPAFLVVERLISERGASADVVPVGGVADPVKQALGSGS
jgi:cell division protein FtsB